jgi:primosomal protein N' (replication factor Y)
MYVQVKLLTGYSRPLLYQVPQDLHHVDLMGKIVHVPIRNRYAPAIVLKTMATVSEKNTFVIKEIVRLEPFPNDTHYHSFIKQLSTYQHIDACHLIERVRQFLVQKNKRTIKKKVETITANPPTITLTSEQDAVCTYMRTHITEPTYTPTLLHGVTGSGKTEVYKNLIVHTIAQNKSVILMLPEVTLALQFERIMRQQLPQNIVMHGFHSAVATSEKKVLWQRLLDQQPTLIIGVHLPILLPIAHLGLIIIDEEHEIGYQEKKHPKINSKEAALLRAKINNIPILLGSATPSISSLHNVKTKKWHFFQLKQRFGGTLPTIKTVFLSDKKERRNFWISHELEMGIKDRLAHHEQIIIFLNRRGFSFFVQCKACSFIFSCMHCSVSLTLHDQNMLSCHYCGMQQAQPATCPACKASENQFLKKGIGTQQVVSILAGLFPTARIARADLDTTTKKKQWQQTVKDFYAGNLDILVGTQTIAKGFHFPRVTLVGILWADLNLNFPLYNASETTLQQLIQVAGRAGRAASKSDVIIQAMADHSLFNYVNEIDYLQFYEEEIASRQSVSYPPFLRFSEIELKHTDEAVLEREAHQCALALQGEATAKKYSVNILGPAKPPLYKIKNIYSRKIYIKGSSIHEIISIFAALKKDEYVSKMYFVPNSLS